MHDLCRTQEWVVPSRTTKSKKVKTGTFALYASFATDAFLQCILQLMNDLSSVSQARAQRVSPSLSSSLHCCRCVLTTPPGKMIHVTWWIRHVTYGWVMSRMTSWSDLSPEYIWYRDSFMCVTWLLHVCDMPYSCVWHASFICTTWLIHMRDMSHSYIWYGSFICVGMPHSCMWYDSFVCVTCLIHMRDMTHSNTWHDSFICVPWQEMKRLKRISKFICGTWLMDMSDMTHEHVRPDSFIRAKGLIHTRDMTHSYEWNDSFMCVTWLIHMGWLRLVGSLKL